MYNAVIGCGRNAYLCTDGCVEGCAEGCVEMHGGVRRGVHGDARRYAEGCMKVHYCLSLVTLVAPSNHRFSG